MTTHITAIYPGSFDPITMGHIDIATRVSKLFSKLIVAVVKNPSKHAFLTLSQRVELAQDGLKHLNNIEICAFEGLTVDFARAHNAQVIVRGLRAVSDFESEFMMSQMNKTLHPELETLFMMAAQDYQFLSSSLVKEVSGLGGDVSSLVSPKTYAYLNRKQQQQQQESVHP